MGAGIAWFSIASALLPAVAITPWTAAAGLTLPAVLASRFLVGFGEGEGPSFTASTLLLDCCACSRGRCCRLLGQAPYALHLARCWLPNCQPPGSRCCSEPFACKSHCPDCAAVLELG